MLNHNAVRLALKDSLGLNKKQRTGYGSREGRQSCGQRRGRSEPGLLRFLLYLPGRLHWEGKFNFRLDPGLLGRLQCLQDLGWHRFRQCPQGLGCLLERLHREDKPEISLPLFVLQGSREIRSKAGPYRLTLTQWEL